MTRRTTLCVMVIGYTIGMALRATNGEARQFVPECEKGGYPEQHCSIQQGPYSCSVNCSEGYYACCSSGTAFPTCDCRADT